MPSSKQTSNDRVGPRGTRIVIAAGIFPPDIGGPATYTAKLAVFLAQHNFDCTVLCYSNRGGNEEQNGYRVRRIRRGFFVLSTYIRYFISLALAAHSADLIYAQGPVAGGIQAFGISKLFGIPYALKITGDYAWEQYAQSAKEAASVDDFQLREIATNSCIGLIRRIQRTVARSAAIVIVPSEYLKKMVMGWGVSPKRLVVVPNSVALMQQRPSRDMARKTLGIEGRMVLTVGRLVPWKGFETVIRCWPQVSAAIPGARLAIVGGGPDEAKLKRLVNSLKLQDQILLVGGQDRSRMEHWYAAADCFVLNSGYEGLSHTILEAQAHGLACAVSMIGGNAEIIEDGRTGMLFLHNSTDAIVAALKKILGNQDFAQQLGKAAREHVKRFDETTMLVQTMGILVQASS